MDNNITYHSERALEAVRIAGDPKRFTAGIGDMLDALAYEHTRGAARAALNMKRKVKK